MLYKYIKKNTCLLFLFLIIFPILSYSDWNDISCSNNPISECAVDRKLNDLFEKLNSSKGNPFFIFASVSPNLKPQNIYGPTNYSGQGTVILTITNNSIFPFNIHCSGFISMKGYSGPQITIAENLFITKTPIEITSKTPIPANSNTSHIVTQTINISSDGSSLSNTLWGAALGTEPTEPLNCSISFVTPSITKPVHVFVPVPYS